MLGHSCLCGWHVKCFGSDDAGGIYRDRVCSYDMTGVFRAASQSLDGLAFQMTFDFDTALGARYTDPNSDYVYGGFLFGLGSVMTSAALTIGSVTRSVPGDYHSTARTTCFPDMHLRFSTLRVATSRERSSIISSDGPRRLSL